jgi:hypothetical protein
LNLTKTYSQLLDFGYMSEGQRNASLMGIFKRDIEDNIMFTFRGKPIRPFKSEEFGMQALFTHLTCHEVEYENPDGSKYKKREFELNRARRLHWIKHHIEERKKEQVEVFSVLERDQKRKRDVLKTYIYDKLQQYVIVLEVQRSRQDYYLLTAYHLNRAEGKKSISKKIAKKLPEVY